MGIDWETLLDSCGDDIQDAYDSIVENAWKNENKNKNNRKYD